MRMLVTGGAGFIGSHLVEALLTAGHSVRVLDDFSSGKRENLAAVQADIELLEGTVVDVDLCRRACAGIERVWHLAAIASVPQSVNHPLAAHQVNLTGTLHMLLTARDAGVQRFVFASSSAIYGANPDQPYHEELLPMPLSPYATQKLAGELYVRQFAALYGLETVALRYFNVYGPRQDPSSQYAAAVPLFFSALLEGNAPTIFDDGEQSREFTYVADCVHGNLQAGFVEGPTVVGGYYNIAAGYPVTVNALLAQMQQVLGTRTTPHYAPARPGDVRYSDARIDKAVAELHFRPSWALADGIRATAEWYRQWHAAQRMTV
jgi:UDP-N-acetylglucosamine/UDP-N-acetylgalactosamine 4-epimerase